MLGRLSSYEHLCSYLMSRANKKSLFRADKNICAHSSMGARFFSCARGIAVGVIFLGGGDLCSFSLATAIKIRDADNRYLMGGLIKTSVNAAAFLFIFVAAVNSCLYAAH